MRALRQPRLVRGNTATIDCLHDAAGGITALRRRIAIHGGRAPAIARGAVRSAVHAAMCDEYADVTPIYAEENIGYSHRNSGPCKPPWCMIPAASLDPH